MNGTCRLCLKESDDIRHSHILPKWSYKRASAGDPLVHVEDADAFTSSFQITAPILCGGCEQRVGVWENYVSSLAAPDPEAEPEIVRFLRMPAVTVWPPTAVTSRFYQSEGLRVADVTRFAVSVLWRSHVARSASENAPPGTDLGRYAETARRFLQEEGNVAFSEFDFMLVAWERTQTGFSLNGTLVYPYRGRSVEGGRCQRFVICGLGFDCYVGQGAESAAGGGSFRRHQVVFRAPPEATGAFRGVEALARDATPRGKLATR